MRDERPPPPTQTARSEPSASKPRSGRRRGSAGTANGRAEAVGLAGDSAPSCDAPPGGARTCDGPEAFRSAAPPSSHGTPEGATR